MSLVSAGVQVSHTLWRITTSIVWIFTVELNDLAATSGRWRIRLAITAHAKPLALISYFDNI